MHVNVHVLPVKKKKNPPDIYEKPMAACCARSQTLEDSPIPRHISAANG
jgi:hypothetical protein